MMKISSKNNLKALVVALCLALVFTSVSLVLPFTGRNVLMLNTSYKHCLKCCKYQQ